MATNPGPDLADIKEIRRVIRQIMRAGERAQMESDCAAMCGRCRGEPDAPDEYIKPAAIDPKRRADPLRGVWRHEWGIKGGQPIGTQACLAAPIRVAWAAAHPKESTDGA